MTGFEDPLYRKLMEHLPAGSQPGEFITSLEVQARQATGEFCGSECCAA
jgi:hypothetical protein